MDYQADDRVYVPSIRLGSAPQQNATVVGRSGDVYLIRMDDEPLSSEPWRIAWYDVEPGNASHRPASMGAAL